VRGKVGPVRYYLYLSQAKLDMLFDQIPQKVLPRLVTEAKVDLKVVGVSVQRPGAELTRYNRLDIVEGYLAQEYDIGWMTEPSFWFRGDLGLRVSVTRSGAGPVFMTGSDDNLVVALVGSAHHVIGNEHAASPDLRMSGSWLPALQALLRQETPDALDDGETLRDTLAFSRRVTGPATWCEFLARRLMHGSVTDEDGREWEVVIGTPLYVAMSEDAG
jgi:hypothetical protein